MKLKVPSSHLETILKNYSAVNRFRLYENTAVLYYSDKPNFKVPLYQAYQLLNTFRKIKKIEVKDERIYIRFKKSRPKNDILLKIKVETVSSLNFSKCLKAVSRFGPVKYFTIKDNVIHVKYMKMISNFIACYKFSNVATISFE